MAETKTASKKTTAAQSTKVAKAYFEAIGRRDLDAAEACWEPGGIDSVAGVGDLVVPDGWRAYFDELFAAFPDFEMSVVETVAQTDRCAVRWRATGTFAGEPFQGMEATGARAQLEGVDVVRVKDGRIVRNDAFIDNAEVARQLGAMPPRDSAAEQRMVKAVNARTRIARRLSGASAPEPIADGVWILRGGFPMRTMNVYLIADDGGVCAFDAGIKAMEGAVGAAAASLGGLTRIVLGHSHADHRGVAPGLGAPVYCHPDERADAESDGAYHTFDFAKLRIPTRWVMPRLLHHWDGGPVEIAGTVKEGDDVAGFEVVHIPGHARGQIALWRESDRLALTTDCFYTLDINTGRHGPPRVPAAAFTPDVEQARASIRKIAALEPAAAWPGHADPVTGDVRSALEQAAAAT